jgi:GntR family transcriptional repressor for pyruvate dehydrogenase complex
MATDSVSQSPAMADVVGLISDLIASRSLQPGQRLPAIRELAVLFEVKAGTVRDALLAAQGQGLLKVVPRVGAIVQASARSISSATHLERQFGESMVQQDQNLFHLLETREALEMSMVARAAQRPDLADLFRLRQILEEMVSIPLTVESPAYVDLDVQFHLELGRLSGNTVMTNLLGILMKELQPHLARIRWSDKRRKETNTSHARIYSALVDGNVELAENEMREHIRTAYDSLLDELRDPPLMNGGE